MVALKWSSLMKGPLPVVVVVVVVVVVTTATITGWPHKACNGLSWCSGCMRSHRVWYVVVLVVVSK